MERRRLRKYALRLSKKLTDNVNEIDASKLEDPIKKRRLIDIQSPLIDSCTAENNLLYFVKQFENGEAPSNFYRETPPMKKEMKQLKEIEKDFLKTNKKRRFHQPDLMDFFRKKKGDVA